MVKSLTPRTFTQGLVEYLKDVRVTEKAIERAKLFLDERRALSKGRPTKEKGYEYIAEIALRPRITRYAKDKLCIPGPSHEHIYSSHFHTTDAEPSDHSRYWEDFKQAHRHVDTDDQGHSRRADLFIAMDEVLVSIEFKYLRAKSKPAVQACIDQIQQHLTKHVGCVLVLYAATPVSERLESAADEIRDGLRGLRGRNGFVVVMPGPPITFP